jgi:hypothetical protein
VGFTLAANGVYDNSSYFTSVINEDAGGGYNLIIDGYRGGSNTVVTSTGTITDTIISPQQASPSLFPQGITLPLGNLYLKSGASTVTGPYWENLAGNVWNVFDQGIQWNLQYTPSGGSQVTLFQLQDGGGGIPWITLPSSIEAIIDCGVGYAVPCLLRGSTISLGSSTATVQNQQDTWQVTAAGAESAVSVQIGGGTAMAGSVGTGGLAQETTSAAKTSGHLVAFDANGNTVDGGADTRSNWVTWAPTDQSGAALAFTVYGGYCNNNTAMHIVFCEVQIGWPSTANTNQASIGGLPVALKGGGIYNVLAPISTTIGFPVAINIATGTTSLVLQNQVLGTPITNAQLSGTNVWMNFSYPTN